MDTQKDKATPRPWTIHHDGRLILSHLFDTRTDHVAVCSFRNKIGEEKANASLIVKAVNNFDTLLEACNKAIEATLDGVVGKAIKDGTLLPEEQHAGLCLLGYIRRKYLATYEQAINQATK